MCRDGASRALPLGKEMCSTEQDTSDQAQCGRRGQDRLPHAGRVYAALTTSPAGLCSHSGTSETLRHCTSFTQKEKASGLSVSQTGTPARHEGPKQGSYPELSRSTQRLRLLADGTGSRGLTAVDSSLWVNLRRQTAFRLTDKSHRVAGLPGPQGCPHSL